MSPQVGLAVPYKKRYLGHMTWYLFFTPGGVDHFSDYSALHSRLQSSESVQRIQ